MWKTLVPSQVHDMPTQAHRQKKSTGEQACRTGAANGRTSRTSFPLIHSRKEYNTKYFKKYQMKKKSSVKTSKNKGKNHNILWGALKQLSNL